MIPVPEPMSIRRMVMLVTLLLLPPPVIIKLILLEKMAIARTGCILLAQLTILCTNGISLLVIIIGLHIIIDFIIEDLLLNSYLQKSSHIPVLFTARKKGLF